MVLLSRGKANSIFEALLTTPKLKPQIKGTTAT